MATVDIKVPSPGESISEVRIARWLVKDGDVVSKDQVLGEIDSDKATLELSAEAEGKVQLLAKEDQTVNVGDVVVRIDTSFKAEARDVHGFGEGREHGGRLERTGEETRKSCIGFMFGVERGFLRCSPMSHARPRPRR